MPKLYDAELRHLRYYEMILGQANRYYLEGGDTLTDGLKMLDFDWENIHARQAWASEKGFGG